MSENIDTDLLEMIFTDDFILSCFEQSMNTTDITVKRSISQLMNTLCATAVTDVSSIDSQCECLLNAIVVCFLFNSNYSNISINSFYLIAFNDNS